MSEDPRALSLVDRISRIPSNRTRVVVPLLELPATSVPRPVVASARFSVFTFNSVGIRMDDKYTAAYSGH